MADTFGSAAALLALIIPSIRSSCLRPHLIRARARRMLAAFPGDVLYAVKCNDAPEVLRALWAGGVREFDTASIGEVRAVTALLPAARCHFMHPVKSAGGDRRGLPRAWRAPLRVRPSGRAGQDRGCHRLAGDLELFVRLAVPGEGAVLALTGKFGVGVDETPVRWCAPRAATPARSGITFHVGSQCVEPVAYARAIALVAEVVRAGRADRRSRRRRRLPGALPGRRAGFRGVRRGDPRRPWPRHGLACRLQCEPGRALVADGASVLTRVELRRGDGLYLNDGVYGNLAELKWIGPQFPMRLVRPARRGDARPAAASTCSGPPATASTACPGRTGCRPTPRTANGSRSA